VTKDFTRKEIAIEGVSILEYVVTRGVFLLICFLFFTFIDSSFNKVHGLYLVCDCTFSF
jgi:hypothetical protein